MKRVDMAWKMRYTHVHAAGTVLWPFVQSFFPYLMMFS